MPCAYLETQDSGMKSSGKPQFLPEALPLERGSENRLSLGFMERGQGSFSLDSLSHFSRISTRAGAGIAQQQAGDSSANLLVCN